MTRMVLFASVTLATLAAPAHLWAQLDQELRVRAALRILGDVATSGAIPTSVLARAEGLVVFPGTVSGVGPQPGVLSAKAQGTQVWSAPAFVSLTGGRLVPAGADVVLVALTRRGIQNVARNRFTLGSGVVAGPVGNAATVSDAQRQADILGYSRAHGEVAGIGLNGASVGANRDSNQRFYGRRLRTGDIAFRGMAGGTGLVREWETTLADVVR